MPQGRVERTPWIVEHKDADGLIHIVQYDHDADAKAGADHPWEDHQGEPGHVVKVSHREGPEGPAPLVCILG